MRTLIFFICMSLFVTSFGQNINDGWKKRDTTEQKNSLQDSLKQGSEMKIWKEKAGSQEKKKIIIEKSDIPTEPRQMEKNNSNHSDITILGKNVYRESRSSRDNKRRYRSFKGHWCGFYYGFVNLAETDYSMYPNSSDEFMTLDWSKSFAMQFNVFEHSINFVPRNNFGMVVGIGLEYQRLMFENKKVSITQNDEGMIIPRPLSYGSIKRNSFKNMYITIPLLLELQFPAKYSRRLYVSAGAVGGLRIHSKTKIVYNNENGEKCKDRDSDNFNQIPFKADLTAKIGYRSINIWGNYTLTDMFRSGKGPELHPYTIGLGFSF